MFRYIRRIWFRTFINTSPTYEDILEGLEKRLTELSRNADGLDYLRFGARIKNLAKSLNDESERLGRHGSKLSEEAPANNEEFGRALHAIMARLGDLEGDRLVLPPSEEARRAFRNEQLYVRTPEEMADRRYLGVWGNYDPRDARRSSWQVIEANRFITRGQAKADASRERRWALFGILVAFAVGITATLAAVLAIPTKESLFCQFRVAERLRWEALACEKPTQEIPPS
jgi:hypothetical protein